MVECYLKCQSDNGSINEENALHQWSDIYFRSIEDLKDPRAPLKLETLCKGAGFVEVESKMIQFPLCAWPTGMRTFTVFLPPVHDIKHLSRFSGAEKFDLRIVVRGIN